MYITEESRLEEFCQRLRGCQWIAIDTEFVREKTYFHHLGLIQVAGNGVSAAIDPIAIKNLKPLLDVIKNPLVLKVFHAGKQDLEILWHLCGEAIRPVFDTQIAASLLGWGSQISFAKAVQKVTGKQIHKSETYTDWCKRPLSENQIEYALDDVRYLVLVYEKLLEKLKRLNRLDWVRGEFLELEDPDNYKSPDPRQQFLKIKNIRNLKPKSLGVLIELAAWREEEAMRRDIHPRSIVRDEPLIEIARLLPSEPAGLAHIRGFHQREVARSGEQILKAIKTGLAKPKEEIPEIPETQGYTTHPGVEELLAAYVQSRSEELKIEPSVLADRKQIHAFVKSYERNERKEDIELLKGWRKDLIGPDMCAIMEGALALAIDKSGKVRLFPAAPDS